MYFKRDSGSWEKYGVFSYEALGLKIGPRTGFYLFTILRQRARIFHNGALTIQILNTNLPELASTCKSFWIASLSEHASVTPTRVVKRHANTMHYRSLSLNLECAMSRAGKVASCVGVTDKDFLFINFQILSFSSVFLLLLLTNPCFWQHSMRLFIKFRLVKMYSSVTSVLL